MTKEKFHDQSPRAYGAVIQLMTPGSPTRLAMDCATGPGTKVMLCLKYFKVKLYMYQKHL